MKDIASKTVKQKMSLRTKDTSDDTNSKKLDIAKRLNKMSLADEISGDSSKVVYKNWFIPDMQQKFPHVPSMWHVDKMYPYAKGGKLLIDEPNNDFEIEECHKKSLFLKELGFRYLIKTPHMTYFEAIETLEGA